MNAKDGNFARLTKKKYLITFAVHVETRKRCVKTFHVEMKVDH